MNLPNFHLIAFMDKSTVHVTTKNALNSNDVVSETFLTERVANGKTMP